MNRSICRFALLALLLAALGISAAAQDVMPLPQFRSQSAGQPAEAAGTRTSPTPDLTAPADLDEMRPMTDFTWLDTGAPKYKITFTETATGIKHTLKVKADKCNGTFCQFRPITTGLFAELSDGMALTWQVTAIMADGKIKSAIRSLTVNEVVQPTLSSPANGANLTFNAPVSWSNANIINEYFRVVFIDPATGKKVMNQYVSAHSCDATCSIIPRHYMPALTLGATYQWYVQAVSYSGETAKSEKRTVVAQ